MTEETTTELQDAPTPDDKYPSTKHFQDYLQKCSEQGQLENMLDRLDSDRRNLEKRHEVCKSSAKSIWSKYQKSLDDERNAQIPKADDAKIQPIAKAN